jgi:hypothetical protein
METMTPTEVAAEVWGRAEAESHSAGARRVRKVARTLFPRSQAEAYRPWHFTPDQALEIKRNVHGP